jgi:hypothetical protein
MHDPMQVCKQECHHHTDDKVKPTKHSTCIGLAVQAMLLQVLKKGQQLLLPIYMRNGAC